MIYVSVIFCFHIMSNHLTVKNSKLMLSWNYFLKKKNHYTCTGHKTINSSLGFEI